MTSKGVVIPSIGAWNGSAPLHQYFVCDVFTSRPLEGNQLGVFVDGTAFEPGEMQRLALELKFAETVFLLPAEKGGDVKVRIFTPGAELPFAGHPVLGTAFVVGQALGKQKVVLETLSGLVPVELDREGERIVFGRMLQPVPRWEGFEREPEILAALGVAASVLPVEFYEIGPGHVFVALGSEDEVAALTPDMAALAKVNAGVNVVAGRGRSWKLRMFYPAGGISEDAASGSAAGPLAVHLARHGRISFGDQIEVRQGVEIRRPSILFATATGSAERIEKIEVGGSAVIVARGEYRISGD